jgi:amino acid transporter
MVRTRSAALVLITLLVIANLVAVVILVVGVLTTSTDDLTGAELLTIGIGVWSANVIVFGVLFWELDSGGPAARIRTSSRTAPDLLFPQDDRPALHEKPWRPQAWDYLYVSLTNSIAFSPTDTMPLSLGAKLTMALESGIAAFSVLLVFARAVNVIGT